MFWGCGPPDPYSGCVHGGDRITTLLSYTVGTTAHCMDTGLVLWSIIHGTVAVLNRQHTGTPTPDKKLIGSTRTDYKSGLWQFAGSSCCILAKPLDIFRRCQAVGLTWTM